MGVPPKQEPGQKKNLETDKREKGTTAAKDVTELTIDPASLGRKVRHMRGLVRSTEMLGLSDIPLLDAGAVVALSAAREKGKLRVQGDISARLQLTCSRCLAVYDYSVMLTVGRFFAQGEDPATGKAQSEMSEDLVFLGEGPFSLLRMVEEELLLELPIKSLCRSTCEGLCDRCGADLNQGLCACPERKEDNPFAVLSSLKTH